MENSISKNNVEISNSIESLKFLWIAEFKDNSNLMQYENGIETRFQEVKERFNELKYFCLYERNYILNRFTVDLEKGTIYYNEGARIESSHEDKKQDIRLIFFRRHIVELTEQLKENKHIIYYFLGFQYNDKDGNNRKIILKIDENNNWCLEN